MSREKWLIPEEKSRRIATAFIVAGVLIILSLAVVLIVQFVRIGITKKQEAALQREIERYEEIIAQREGDLGYYESVGGRYRQALERGWKSR